MADVHEDSRHSDGDEEEDENGDRSDGEVDSHSEGAAEPVINNNTDDENTAPHSQSGAGSDDDRVILDNDHVRYDDHKRPSSFDRNLTTVPPKVNDESPSTATKLSSPTQEIRKPIKVEYSDHSIQGGECEIESPSPPGSPNKTPEFISPESPVNIVNTSELKKEPLGGNAIGPASPIDSPSVGFESLSPQSMLDEDDDNNQSNRVSRDGDVEGRSNGCVVTPKVMQASQSLEDQEGELDFEEETPEERRDAATKATTKVTTKLRQISMMATSTEKALPVKSDNKSEEKEEGEEEDDDDDDGEGGEDDGEVEDDDDLEEGEVKESTGLRKIQPKPICRFYSKGQCTWGSACRFLHPGVNDKGNYNMFAPTKTLIPRDNALPSANPYVWPARQPAVSPTFGTRGYVEPLVLPLPPPLPPPPPPVHFEEPARESAWERGLRQAKEILRKSSKRKETEPDFEEKRMNLSVGGVEASDFEKDSDYYDRRSPYRHVSAAIDPYDEPLDPYERQAHDYWRGGNYENFEVRYTRNDYPYRQQQQQDRNRLNKDRERGDQRDVRDRERDMYREPPLHDRERGDRSRRDKFDRIVQHSSERNYRDDRYADRPPVASRSGRGDRGDEWCDPWRRSTSPKRRNLSRSFSSRSSMSYSSSGHSSGSRSSSYSSHSRSSSGSSNSSYSSRSYSPTRTVHQHQSHNHHHHHQSNPASIQQHTKAPPAVNKERANKYPPAGHDNAGPEVHRRPKPLPVGGHIPPQTTSGVRPPVDKRPTAAQVQAPVHAVQPQQMIERRRPQQQKPITSAAAKGPTRRRSLSTSGSDSLGSRSKNRVAPPSTDWAPGNRQRKSRSRSSRSHSSSGSSLISVSSKNSASSRSSANSGENMSTLDALKREERRARERERLRAVDTAQRRPPASSGGPPDRERERNVRDFKAGVDSQADLRVKSLVNAPKTSKDPLRQAGQKPQIKLTLLNKAQPADKHSPAMPQQTRKPVLEPRKLKPAAVVVKEELNKPVKIPTPNLAQNIRKRPLPSSPPVRGGPDTTSATAKAPVPSRAGPAVTNTKGPLISAAAAALLNKKSTSSRREELLKQLKAVEDAIARKRAKFT